MHLFNTKPPFRSHGGVKLPHKKSTQNVTSKKIPTPGVVIIPVLQHIGAPCKVKVNVGDFVKIGETIAQDAEGLSVPIHASISGKVTRICETILLNGEKVEAIEIESDGKDEIAEDVAAPQITSRAEFVEAIRKSGLVGLGGAGFPTFAKLNISKDKSIHTLVINAAECEPYITTDNRTIIENTLDIFCGIALVQKFLNIENVVIGIEDNKPEAISVLKDCVKFNDLKNIDNQSKKNARQAESELIKKYDLSFPKNLSLLKLKAIYPAGAERTLIKKALNLDVPPGKLPLDIGCLVMNVSTIAFVAQHLANGLPLVYRRITVEGSCVKKPQNLIVPIGTRISDILNFCEKKEPIKKIIIGGPMMGTAIDSTDFPILKQTNAVLFFSEKESILPSEQNCIRCGKCVNSCPMSLYPNLLDLYARAGHAEELYKFNIYSCVECGCCSFVCPAKRHLVHHIKLGKDLLKTR
ncbi:MAG: electron transport complex subunit RsxC [Clostridia bacterium]|nr:electron transport complex subunit RsxC [Clostridia bacterium]